ncbi:hypothetical protein B0A89_13170 [Paracoccus contaminans]|uniref:Type III secretion protein n=1 Tax=Paracoccus contaminans TaxID=1945662 RepID=A0A1W6D021_9RHOB|nr:hypothetical protein B0A89_13170 [Paracoccus contaminans]
MVTAVTQMTGSAVAAASGQGAEGGPQLSELARRALDGLGEMSDAYAASSRAVEAQMSRPIPAGADITAQIQAAQDSMRIAMQVQQQVLQFSMATSISSSLGNNLNSFLKGA